MKKQIMNLAKWSTYWHYCLAKMFRKISRPFSQSQRCQGLCSIQMCFVSILLRNAYTYLPNIFYVIVMQLITAHTAYLCRCREMDFLKKVHETVEKGGKVSSCSWYQLISGAAVSVISGQSCLKFTLNDRD